jgi:hypothetical protein
MWEFADRLVNSRSAHSTRDFKRRQPEGLRRPRQLHARPSKSTSSFPEIDYDKIDKIKGMNISIRHHGEDG